MRFLFITSIISIAVLSSVKNSKTSEYQTLKTPEQYTAESFLRKQKREEKLSGILIASLTTENIDDMLVAAARVKDASNDRLPHQLIIRLFAKQSVMTTEQTLIMLDLLRSNMSKTYLSLLNPLLFSHENDVAEKAFTLFSELPYNYQTKHVYLKLSHSSSSQLVRSEVLDIIGKRTI
ncbi:hypothetical protein [Thalassotalea fusca]